MEQERKAVVSLEMPASLREWLVRKSAERLIAGRPKDERSMSAIIRDLIAEAMRQEAA